MKSIINWYKQDKYILLLSLFLGTFITLIFGFYSKAYSNNIQQNISSELVRLHIIANSDSNIDQNLKLKVRNKVLEEYAPILENLKDINETKKFLNDNLYNIEETAKSVIISEGFNYDVSATIEKVNFPTVQYGNIKLPAGEYTALEIKIGQAEGLNWWCIMFPPLCFVNITKGEISEDMKEKLKDSLSLEEFELISNEDNEIINVKFKIVEWWQELQQKNKIIYDKAK